MALVQAPQDHRDGNQSRLKSIMNSEYAGFFDIGMVQRNEDDAIITHGTMCMVRRSALEYVGGWGTDTICEDTELGLRLYEAGYQALYTNHRYGRGMLPDTFKAFKTQRFRWAYGAMQIIRKHWTHMLPGARTLTPAQKFHFLAGWSLWFSDALGTLASVLNLIWVPVVIFVGVVIPTIAFTVPILAAFVVNLLHCALLYARRVEGAVEAESRCGSGGDEPAVDGCTSGADWNDPREPSLPADRQGRQRQAGERKSGEVGNRAGRPAGFLSAVVLMLLNKTHVIEMTVFAATLLVQSIPFLAAAAMVAVERVKTRPEAAPRRPSAFRSMAMEAPTKAR